MGELDREESYYPIINRPARETAETGNSISAGMAFKEAGSVETSGGSNKKRTSQSRK